MVACHAANSQGADAALTRVYEAVLAKLGPSPQRDLLRSSQEAWLAYRTAYCSFVSSAVEGGSLQPMVRNACHADLARIRIKELELQLNCQEGNVKLRCSQPPALISTGDLRHTAPPSPSTGGVRRSKPLSHRAHANPHVLARR